MPGRSRARAILAVALGAIVVASLDAQFLTAWRSAGRRVGIGIEERAGGVAVTSVEAGSPAARGGLRAGELLHSLDGGTVGKSSDYDPVARRFRRGRPVSVAVTRDGRPLALTLVPGMAMPWLDLFSGSAVVVAYLGLALLTLYQRQPDLRARLLFMFSAAVALEMALPTNVPVVGNLALGTASTALSFLLNGAQIGLELHLASVIPDPASWLVSRRWLAPLYYTGGMVIGGVVCVAYVADVLGRQVLPWSYDQVNAAYDVVGFPLWAVAVSGILLYRAATHPEPVGRQQALLVLAGELPWAAYSFASAGMQVAGVAMPAWADFLQQPILLCYPAAVFVAIFRYRLFDLEVVVRRSIIYAALTGTLLLVFYAAVGAGGALVSQWVEGSVSVIAVSAATLLLGLLFSPLRHALQRLIDRRFFPERYAQRQRLIALAGQLPSYGKLPLMGRHLVGQLCEIFAASSTTLLVADPKSGLLVTVASTNVNPERDFDQSFLIAADDPGVQALRRGRRPVPASQLSGRSASLAQRLRAFGAALVVPVPSQDALIGIILLGGKPGGVAFPAEEIELLSLLAHHVGTVLENARLFESATTDGLTGLLRRETVLAQLERELQRALRYRRPLTVGMTDLDRFKEINDRHGHLVGDALLKLVARALSAGLRGTDSVGRYGGDEFLVVLPETDLGGAVVVAEKIRAAVDGIVLHLEDGGTVGASVSIGLAALEQVAADGEPTPETIVAAADRNLLRAKAGGRNRIEPGSPSNV